MLAPLLGACEPLPALNAALVWSDRRIEQGAAYGPHERQRLDVYAPEDAVAAPVIVFLHGGSWTSGERAHYRFVGEAIASRGLIAVIPDYRLHPEARFPDFVEDAALAVRWAYDHADRLGGDPSRLVVMGHSAGAHTAALLALDGGHLAPVGLTPQALAAMIGLAGPYAFDPLEYRATRPIFEHLDDPERARPITFADGDGPPMLLLHGEADGTVLLANTLRLADARRAAGGRVEVRTYRRIGHVPLVLALLPAFRWLAPVLDDVETFVHGL